MWSPIYSLVYLPYVAGEKVSMVATTVSTQILRTMAKAEGFHYDVSTVVEQKLD